VIVRAARPEDALAVATVHVRSWQAGYRGLLADAYLDTLRPEDRMARYDFTATGPDAAVTAVAVVDGMVRGFATTGPRRHGEGPDAGTPTGEVLALYVDPDAWGTGIGTSLLADARARLAARGFADAVLWVLAGNDRAERLYRSDGWTSDGHLRRVEVWGTPVDELRYRRTLP
jgi:GNAT superfamily N-acetyltransferase